ncbi:MAG: Holliday junction resolvase RuvX [Enterobacterales bacterium]
MKTKFFICFDFGIKNIGVAIGQNITYTAQPLKILFTKNNIFNEIRNIVKEWQPYAIIVGLPLDINGKDQYLTFKTREFAKNISKIVKIDIYLHDERFSTVEARSCIFNIKGYKGLKKYKIDDKSAVLILESWFREYKNC